MSNPRSKFLDWRTQTSGLIFERMAEINGILLATASRKHIVLVGPGGTAKSLIGRLWARTIDGAVWFDYQFNKYSVPEDVFGPPSIKALEEGTFRRVTKNRLPEAHFALGDEVFEANASILNSIRKVLNERMYENDGENKPVPLEVFIGATNLIPTEETLAALYDRFHLRYKVQYIAEPSHFIAMLEGPKRFEEFAQRVTVRMSLDEVHDAQNEASQVSVPRTLAEGMYQIRATLAQQGIMPSDRRWNEAYEIVKAKAWLQGRAEAIMDDLSVLVDLLWNDPTSKQLVQGVVLDVANPLLKRAEELHDAFQVAYANAQKVTNDKERSMAMVEALSKTNQAVKALRKLKADGEKEAMDMSLVDSYITAAENRKFQIKRDELKVIDEAEAQ